MKLGSSVQNWGFGSSKRTVYPLPPSGRFEDIPGIFDDSDDEGDGLDDLDDPSIGTPHELINRIALMNKSDKPPNNRERFVFRVWPRDPKGGPITPENSVLGKTTSNGLQLWGATILDFFFVSRFYDNAFLRTTSTGSKLSGWMKKHGELEAAASEIQWADMEDDPREVFPSDVLKAILASEAKIADSANSQDDYRTESMVSGAEDKTSSDNEDEADDASQGSSMYTDDDQPHDEHDKGSKDTDNQSDLEHDDNEKSGVGDQTNDEESKPATLMLVDDPIKVGTSEENKTSPKLASDDIDKYKPSVDLEDATASRVDNLHDTPMDVDDSQDDKNLEPIDTQGEQTNDVTAEDSKEHANDDGKDVYMRVDKESMDDVTAEREKVSQEQTNERKDAYKRVDKESKDEVTAEREKVSQEQTNERKDAYKRVDKESKDEVTAEGAKVSQEQTHEEKDAYKHVDKESKDEVTAEEAKVSQEQTHEEKDAYTRDPKVESLIVDDKPIVDSSVDSKIVSTVVDAQEEVETNDNIKEWPPKSVFSPYAYPPCWPRKPFSEYAPKLQQRLPFYALPRELVVHDPYDLLSVHRRGSHVNAADNVPDRLHTYKLQLTPAGSKRERQEREEAKDAYTAKLTPKYDPLLKQVVPHGYMLTPLELLNSGPIEPQIYVVHSPPPMLDPEPRAHLYLSPKASAGTGHHSVVYKGEWEIPRSTLLPAEMCKICVRKDVERILREQDGENGEKRDPKWSQKCAKVTRRLIVKEPVTTTLYEAKTYNGQVDDKPNGEREYLVCPGKRSVVVEYEGPLRFIHTTVGWQSLDRGSYCSHLTHRIHPLTARTTVIAKLSIEHDNHLKKEASNYQKFPRHFFEHWNGYNIVPPLHSPVPVGALVPQFYGYYIPIEKPPKGNESNVKSDSKGGVQRKYLSPILLIEDCGVEINPRELNLDERSECASLILRFNDADWIHGSIYPRNILCQPGPICRRSPIDLHASAMRYSFRLIDFGRSEHFNGDDFSVFHYEKHTVGEGLRIPEIDFGTSTTRAW